MDDPQVDAPQVGDHQEDDPQEDDPQVGDHQEDDPQVDNPQVDNPQVGDQQVGNGAGNPAVQPADLNTRKTTLKNELVTNYIAAKNAEKTRIEQAIINAGGGPAVAPAAASSGGGASKHLNRYMDASGFIMDGINAAVGAGNSVMGFKELYADDGSNNSTSTNTENGSNSSSNDLGSDGGGGNTTGSDSDSTETETEKDKLEKKHKPYKKINNYISLGTSVWGGINNSIAMHTNRKKFSSKNERVRRAGRFGFSSNFFGFLANASKATTAGLNIWGDQDEKHTKRATRWMGAVGSLMGLISAGTTLAGSITDKVSRKRIRNEADLIASSIDTNNADETLTKQNLDQDKNNGNWLNYETNKKHLNSLKAQKIAMKHAAKMNSVRADQNLKGIAGTVGGLASFVGSLTNAIPKFADSGFGKFMKAAGGAITAVTNIAKQHERIDELSTRKKILEKKKEIINEYIGEKMPKLDNDLAPFLRNHPEITNVTNNEKRRIIVARLGADVEIENKKLEADDKEKAFKAINHKRALTIMNAEDNVRQQLFSTLRLDDQASIQDVEAALSGD